MAETYNMGSNSSPKPNHSESKKISSERSGGPLSDRRIQIAVGVAAIVVVLLLAVFAIGALGRPVKTESLQEHLAREKALRERDEAPSDPTAQSAQPASGQSSAQSAIRPTD